MVVASVKRLTSPRSDVTIRGGCPRLVESSLSSLLAPWTRTSGSRQPATSVSRGSRSRRLPPILMTSTSDRIEAREVEPGLLVPAKANIHRLDGLPGGAFHQVVERAHHHHPPRMRVSFEADVAAVRPRQDLRVGVAVDPLRLLDDSHEGLVRVGGAIDLPRRLLVQVIVEKDVGGRQDSADGLDRGRGEGDAGAMAVGQTEAKLLDDL